VCLSCSAAYFGSLFYVLHGAPKIWPSYKGTEVCCRARETHSTESSQPAARYRKHAEETNKTTFTVKASPHSPFSISSSPVSCPPLDSARVGIISQRRGGISDGPGDSGGRVIGSIGIPTTRGDILTATCYRADMATVDIVTIPTHAAASSGGTTGD